MKRSIAISINNLNLTPASPSFGAGVTKVGKITASNLFRANIL